jgi:hypothetical protein
LWLFQSFSFGTATLVLIGKSGHLTAFPSLKMGLFQNSGFEGANLTVRGIAAVLSNQGLTPIGFGTAS